MNKTIGRYNEAEGKVEFFYNILKTNKGMLLKKQTFDILCYYAYNSKTGKIGLLPIVRQPSRETFNDIIIHENIAWEERISIFFKATSKMVTELGSPKYNQYLDIYKTLIDIKRIDIGIKNGNKKIYQRIILMILNIKKSMWLRKINIELQLIK